MTTIITTNPNFINFIEGKNNFSKFRYYLLSMNGYTKSVNRIKELVK